MSQGFYERLAISDTASLAEVESAFQKQLATLVRRLRQARAQGADVRILEAQERGLREARAVLGDPVRRRRYDAFRKASEQGIPETVDQLWSRHAEALVDPTAISALRVVRTLTELPVGDPFPGVAEPAAPLPALRMALPPAPAVPGAPPATPTSVQVSITDPGFAEAGDTALVELLGRIPQQLDPLDELLSDLSGTDPGLQAGSEPTDPVDRMALQLGYDGRFLKAVREHRGLSLESMAQSTRISHRYLEALEANAWDQLPAATFVRGYLKEIVRVLALGDRDVVGGYMALYQRQRG